MSPDRFEMVSIEIRQGKWKFKGDQLRILVLICIKPVLQFLF